MTILLIEYIVIVHFVSDIYLVILINFREIFNSNFHSFEERPSLKLTMEVKGEAKTKIIITIISFSWDGIDLWIT
jgi:phosphatidylglycerophosphate synthase